MENNGNTSDKNSTIEYVKSFAKEMNKTKSNHIYFNDTDHSDDDEKNKTENVKVQDDDVILIDEVSDPQQRKCVLVRNSKNESFGFQINGTTNAKGKHAVSSVSRKSSAELAGLRVNDKIISVNGQPTENSTIDELIKLIESETKKNPLTLEFVVNSKESTIKYELIELDNEESVNDNKSERDANQTNAKHRKRLATSVSPSTTNREIPKKKRTLERRGHSTSDSTEKNDDRDVVEKNSEKNGTEVPAQKMPPTDTAQNNAEFDLDIESVSFYSQSIPNKLPNIPPINVLNEKAAQIRRELSETGKFVTWKEIIYLLLKFYKCKQIGEFGITHVTHLETINELIRYQRKIDSFILEYNLTISYSTYYELEVALCKYLNISNYMDINVGPLCENKLVGELFKFPKDVQVHDLKANQITYLDLFRYLRKYLDEKQLWSAKTPLVISEFEDYLKEKLNLTHLPVRINSVAIMIGVMKNVKRLYNESYKKSESDFNNELKVIFDSQRELIKKELNKKLSELQKHNSDKTEMQSQLNFVRLEPDFLLNELLTMFEMILNENDYEYINDFIKTITTHDYLKYIFSLAVFMLKQHDLKFYLEKLNTNPNNSNSYINILKRIFIKLADYLNKKQLKTYLNRFLFEKKIEIVDFDSIKRKHIHYDDKDDKDDEDIEEIENDKQDVQTKKSQVASNDQLNRSIVNDFMVLNKLKELAAVKLEELNIVELLNHLEENYFELIKCDQADTIINYLMRNKNEFEFLFSNRNKKNVNEKSAIKKLNKSVSAYLRQLIRNLDTKHLTRDLKAKIENLLCSHYDILSISELDPNIENIESLINDLDFDNKTDNNNNEFIIYEDAILDNELNRSQTTDSSDEDELKGIYKLLIDCPLLDNLYEYTQWCVMYSKNHGNLKEFINNTNSRFELNVLGYEVMPNCLLKLTNDTSLTKLKDAILNYNHIDAAGHLVSLIVVKYESLKKAPNMLIANELYSTFLTLYNDNNNNLEKFYLFIVKFLCRLPLKFLSNCLFKFFIEPLTKIEGSVQVVKQSLLDNVLKNENETCKNYFHNLSILCSIPEWSNKNDVKEVENYEPDQLILQSNSFENLFEKSEIIKIEFNDSAYDAFMATSNSSNVISQVNETIDTNVSSTSLIQKEQIEKIRLNKYGIGLTLNQQNEEIMKALKNEISSCLQTLSNELYNKDMHFVLELIQNADDNKYTNENKPTIIFLIDTNAITLFNNEVGFNERNIQAISSIGASTKGKHEHGYIGRKGIGFKSVFTVTNCPEIHSNDYHIKFDANNKQFGHFNYIVPIWCENNDNFVNNKTFIDNICKNEYKNLTTCIHLPLKSETERQRHKSRSLTHSFNDIKSSLLLFLNRLKNIVLINRVQLTKRLYTRIDIGDDLIEIIENNFKLNESLTELQAEKVSQKWLIKRKNLHVPNTIEKPNLNIQCTDICLAFPLYSLNYVNTIKSLPKLDAYAYLPIRCFNFSFIIQADFMLTASRQDIINDSDWNQWLANEIPQLYIDSFDSFFNYYHSSKNLNDKISVIQAYLKFIPFEYEISNDFFQHIPKQIIQLVHNMSILPVLINESSDTLVLKKPHECILIKDKQIRELLTQDMLELYLERYYLNPKLYENSEGVADEHMHKILFKLGVRQLQIDDILNIIKIIFSNITTANINFKHASKWLIILNNYLQTNDSNNKLIMNEIKKLRFLPILNRDGLTSLDETKNVYFSHKFNNNEITNENIDYLTDSIESELNIIDLNRLLCLENDLLNNSLINFLNNLGIKSLNSAEIIENHIIPTFELSKLVDFSIDQKTKLIVYLLYLQNYWLINPDLINKNYEKLKSTVLVLVNDTTNINSRFLSISDDHIYLNSIYSSADSEMLDEELLKNLKIYFVDTIYLNETIKLNKINKKLNMNVDNLITNWRKFMNYFDVYDVFTPRKRIFKISSRDIQNNLPETNTELNEFLKKQQDKLKNDETYEVIDYICEAFDYFTSKVTNLEKFQDNDKNKTKFIDLFNKFFKIFNNNWSTTFESYKFMKILIVNEKKCEKNLLLNSSDEKFQTTFYSNLKSKSWVLTQLNDYYLETNEIKTRIFYQFLKPNEAYLKIDPFLAYYGENQVPYFCNLNNIDANKSFINDLNVNVTFNFIEFLEKFKTTFQINASTIADCSEFKFIKLKQIKSIYSLFSTHLVNSQNKILNEIIENRFIFIPTKVSNDVAYGQFYSKQHVYWCDPTSLLTKYQHNLNLHQLKSFYSTNETDFKKLFVDYFKCNQIPTLNDYIGLIEFIIRNLISEKFSLNNQILNDLFEIYELIYEEYCCTNGTLDDSKKEEILSLIKGKILFICYNNKYLVKDDLIVLNDNFAVSKYFKEKLNFLILPSKSNENYLNFNDAIFKFTKLNKNLRNFLTNICNLKQLNSIIETSIDLLRGNLDLEYAITPNLLIQLVPYVQYFLYSKAECIEIYNNFKTLLTKCDNNLLVNLKLIQINTIYLNYTVTVDRNISASNDNEQKVFIRLNSNNSIDYYIRKDCFNNEKELIKGFLKIFFMHSKNNFEKLEKELLNFVLYLNNSFLKTSQSLTINDRCELENDYEIKLSLPDNEPAWLVKDANQIASSDAASVRQPVRKLSTTQSSSYLIDPLFSVYTELAREQQSLPNELSQIPLANNRNYITTNRNTAANSTTTTTTFTTIQINNNSLIAENNLNNFMHRANTNSKSFLMQNFSSNNKTDLIVDDVTHEFRVFNNEIKIDFNNKTTNESIEECKNKVGRWGELFIYKMLVNKYKTEIKEHLIKIEWINEDNETGHPYDIKFIKYDENDWGTVKEEIFIEVKSTIKSDNELNDYFPVSVREVMFASANSSSYQIYRLYNALSTNLDLVKIKRITNIHNNLVKHNLNLVMIV